MPWWRFLIADRPVSLGYKVDITRGELIGRVSSEWDSRPDDERYLSLSELYAAVRSRADRAMARTVESRAVRVVASRGRRRAAGADRARPGGAGSAHPLELQPTL
jgi:hypothetical protein